MKKLSFLSLLSLSVGMAYARQTPLSITDSIKIKNYFFAGLSDRIRENYHAAQANFKKILEIDSANDAANYELAVIHINQKRLWEAELSIKKSLVRQPENVWYLRTLSDIYKMNGNTTRLLPVLDKLINLSPETESFYFDKANVCFLLNNKGEALQTLDKIEQKFGNSKNLELVRQRLKAPVDVTTLEKILQDETNDVTAYLDYGGQMLEKGKPEDALSLLLKAKQIAPNKYEVNLALADVYKALNKPDEAFEALKQAFQSNEMPFSAKLSVLLKLQKQVKTTQKTAELTEMLYRSHPKDEKLAVLYGDILFRQGELDKAKVQYRKALEISGEFYVAWEKLLAVQTLTGEYEAAIKTGEEALSYYPNQAILYYYRAFALHRNGKTAEAALELKNAQALESDDVRLKALILALQAEVWIDQGKFKDAEVAFNKSLELSPDDYQIMSSFAYFLALRNHALPKAELLASKAASAMPENASVLDTYALVLFKLGKYNKALNCIQRVLDNKEQNNAVYLEHYGDILFMTGKKEEALKAWEKAQEAGNRSEKLIKKINEKKYIK